MKKKSFLVVAATLIYAGLFAQTTTLLLQPGVSGKDAMLDSYSPNLNHANDEELDALGWTISGTPFKLRGLMEFDLSSIPPGSIIIYSCLTLFNNPTSLNGLLNGEHSHLSGSNLAYVQRVTSAWSENTDTWNNQPTSTITHQVALPQDTARHENYAVDVTQLVQDMIDSSNSHGFLIKLANENYYRCLLFATGDYPNAALHPRLEVTYVASCKTHLMLQPNDEDGMDAMLDSYHPNSNHATDQDLDAQGRTIGGTPFVLRSLLDFYLGSIPYGSIIHSASLVMYNNPTAMNALLNGQHSHLSGSNMAYVQRVTSHWNENTVTWNTQPTSTNVHQAAMPQDTFPFEDYVVDVTQIVQDM